jgi:hypothetical protein
MTREEFWTEFETLSDDLGVRHLGRVLEVSVSTASRWKHRQSAPPGGLRRLVLEFLRQKVKGACERRSMDLAGARAKA